MRIDLRIFDTNILRLCVAIPEKNMSTILNRTKMWDLLIYSISFTKHPEHSRYVIFLESDAQLRILVEKQIDNNSGSKIVTLLYTDGENEIASYIWL